jgi:hypothetical protein
MAAAQAKDQALERYCAARTRNGGLCKQPAGHGTPHPGKGPCKLHGGCMPNVVKRYATIEAREAIGKWGIELDIDPFEGILASVRMAYGAVAAFKARLKDDSKPDSPEVIAWMAAQKHAAQIAKMAIDAGIAERQVQIAERMAEQIAMAYEDALADEDLSPEQVSRIAAKFSAGLMRLEGEVIEGSESG